MGINLISMSVMEQQAKMAARMHTGHFLGTAKKILFRNRDAEAVATA